VDRSPPREHEHLSRDINDDGRDLCRGHGHRDRDHVCTSRDGVHGRGADRRPHLDHDPSHGRDPKSGDDTGHDDSPDRDPNHPDISRRYANRGRDSDRSRGPYSSHLHRSGLRCHSSPVT